MWYFGARKGGRFLKEAPLQETRSHSAETMGLAEKGESEAAQQPEIMSPSSSGSVSRVARGDNRAGGAALSPPPPWT